MEFGAGFAGEIIRAFAKSSSRRRSRASSPVRCSAVRSSLNCELSAETCACKSRIRSARTRIPVLPQTASGRKARPFFHLVREQQQSTKTARSRPHRSSLTFSGSHRLAWSPPRLNRIILLHRWAAVFRVFYVTRDSIVLVDWSVVLSAKASRTIPTRLAGENGFWRTGARGNSLPISPLENSE